MTPETRNKIISLLLVALALALFVAIGGDGEAEMAEHARWEAQVKDQGAWVMW